MIQRTEGKPKVRVRVLPGASGFFMGMSVPRLGRAGDQCPAGTGGPGMDRKAFVRNGEGILSYSFKYSPLPKPYSNKLSKNETSILPKQDGPFIEYRPERLI